MAERKVFLKVFLALLIFLFRLPHGFLAGSFDNLCMPRTVTGKKSGSNRSTFTRRHYVVNYLFVSCRALAVISFPRRTTQGGNFF